MSIPSKFKGRFFYHFTHVDNIESILKHGLLATNEKKSTHVSHINIANEKIQENRSHKLVPCKPYGTIHDYVPFYFTQRSPMLLGVLNRKNIDQPFVVYIAISIEKILESDVLFTNIAANNSDTPIFYQDPSDLDNLNWTLIDSKSWNEKNNENLHLRMAEVLKYKKMPIDWIDHYIVYNEIAKGKIEEFYADSDEKLPPIHYNPYFYYTKFMFDDRGLETLITGPKFLNLYFKNVIEEILQDRKINQQSNYLFENIKDALNKIDKKFNILPELEGINNLITDNKVHTQTVSEHTLKVVENLELNEYYRSLNPSDKNLVKFSAYLHDIGKGPKSKWKNEIQTTFSDHPADSIPMLKRILSNEFKTITEYEIRKICLLVIYHDIIGDIITRGRNLDELLELAIDEKELTMLVAISIADITAITPHWFLTISSELPKFIAKIKKEIS